DQRADVHERRASPRRRRERLRGSPAHVSIGGRSGPGRSAAGGDPGHAISPHLARRSGPARARDRPAAGRAASVLRGGRRRVSRRAPPRHPRRALRWPGFLLVRRAERRRHSPASRPGRFPAMKRAFLAAALIALPAAAYNEAVHAFITRRALPNDAPVAAPTQEDLDAFRAQFWIGASANAAFAARYPTIHDFGAWDFKQFLMLDPAARVHGFDLTPDDDVGSLATLLERASRWPDDDARNRN